MTTFYIKNMVCNRCIMVVRQQFENLGFYAEKVILGEVTVREEELTAEQWNRWISPCLPSASNGLMIGDQD